MWNTSYCIKKNPVQYRYGTEEAKLCPEDMTNSGSKYTWYAAYTRSRAEKRARDWLLEEGYEVYLPIKKVLRQWSDRKKMVDLPLIPSYIFIRVSEKEYYKAINTPYTVKYVTFNGKAAPIPDREINMLKLIMNELPDDVEVITSGIEKGDMVEITSGALKGSKGEVVLRKGKHHFQIRLEPVGFAVQVQIAGMFLKKIKEK